MKYVLGDLLIDTGRQSVSRSGAAIALPKLSYDLLLTLIRAAPNLVSLDELLRQVWPGLIVSPETVSKRVMLLRDALGEDPRAPRYIAGLRGRGYQIIGDVSELTDRVTELSLESERGLKSEAPRIALRRVSIPALTVTLLFMIIAGALLWRSLRPAATARPQATSHAAVQKPETVVQVFSPPARSVAVMPFVNMSGDPNEEYFSDGVSEELLNELSRLNDLQVVARSSSFSFKGQNVDAATIAHKLNVGAILEGSVRRSGNTVRITAQLINTVTGFHLWSETYDRPFTDILKVQTEVATAVARQLRVKLTKNESDSLSVGGTQIPEAYDAYLRAHREWDENEGVPEDKAMHTALAAADQAIKLDPHYAAAYALRGTLLQTLSIQNLDQRENLAKQARASAERAVALAPDFGEAHAWLARILNFCFYDFVGAESEYEKAVALAPGSADVQFLFSAFAAKMGHVETALTHLRLVSGLDPHNYQSYMHQAGILSFTRQFGEAQVALRHAQALKPDSSPSLDWLQANLFLALGQAEQARQLCEAPVTRFGEAYKTYEGYRHECLALAYHALGRQADAKSELELYKAMNGEKDTQAFEYAQIYAQLGDKAQALEWLAKAERNHDFGLTFLRCLWQFDPIREEPQFKAIEARMNFPAP
jgi:adenylate cyclase